MLTAYKFVILDWNTEIVNWLIRITIAALCGGMIGFERKSRSKEAGIRTHTIVCMASAIMMIVSKYGFADADRSTDYARIAAQVVSGIGFLGAGIIFYRRDFLRGLTTAAGIWATAGIGLAIGSGLIVVGVFSAVMLLLLQIFLHRPIKFLKPKPINVLKMSVFLPSADVIDKLIYIFDIKKFIKFKSVTGENGILTAEIEAVTEENFSAKALYEFTQSYDFIKSLEIIDEL